MKSLILKLHTEWLWALLFVMLLPLSAFSQSSYPVHVSVQALPPYSIYLTDYYNRLIVRS